MMVLPPLVGRQSDVVYMAPQGHLVVLGTAGTGKTVMAMSRALYLASPSTPNAGPVALLTYNNALVAYLKHLRPPNAAPITVGTYAKFARGYLHSRGAMPSWGGIADVFPRQRLVNEALTIVSANDPNRFYERDIGFFLDELAWLSELGVSSLDEYLTIERRGRVEPLSRRRRERVWALRETYLALRVKGGYLYDWHDLPTAVRTHLVADNSPRMYRHVVLDEGQDLAPEAIRSIANAVPPDGSISFFGDYAQQIYGQDLSWRTCGLNVNRVEKFSDNYRNTGEIARLAIAMSEMPEFGGDPADLVAPRAPTAAGPLPSLVECDTQDAECQVVRQLAPTYAAGGTVAVLARTWDLARRACKGLPARSLDPKMKRWDPTPGIYCGAYHSAKGLEFDAVIMPFCSADEVPRQDVVEAFGPEEANAREAKLLYVGVTRARTELVVTFSGTRSPLLPPDTALWNEDKL